MSLFLALVAAQIASAPAGPWQIETPDARQTGTNRALQIYARCVVAATTSGTIDNFLRLAPGSSEFQQRAGQIAARCSLVGFGQAPPQLRFADVLLRGSLFEARYRLMSNQLVDVRQLEPLNLVAEFGGDGSVPDSVKAARVVGDCTVRRDAVDARALVLTDTGTAAEDAAVVRIESSVQACALTEDRVRISRPALRGMLAEALYKMSASTQARR